MMRSSNKQWRDKKNKIEINSNANLKTKPLDIMIRNFNIKMSKQLNIILIIIWITNLIVRSNLTQFHLLNLSMKTFQWMHMYKSRYLMVREGMLNNKRSEEYWKIVPASSSPKLLQLLWGHPALGKLPCSISYPAVCSPKT